MHRAAQCHTGCHTHQSTQPPCDAAPRRMPLSLWLHHLLAPLSSSTELHTDEICIQVRSTQVVVFFNFVQENRDASAVQFCAPLLRAEKSAATTYQQHQQHSNVLIVSRNIVL